MFDSVIANPAIALTFKLGVLLLLGLYMLFLFVILKQIRSMNTIITQPDLFPIIQTGLFLLILFNIFIFVVGVAIL